MWIDVNLIFTFVAFSQNLPPIWFTFFRAQVGFLWKIKPRFDFWIWIWSSKVYYHRPLLDWPHPWHLEVVFSEWSNKDYCTGGGLCLLYRFYSGRGQFCTSMHRHWLCYSSASGIMNLLFRVNCMDIVESLWWTWFQGMSPYIAERLC